MIKAKKRKLWWTNLGKFRKRPCLTLQKNILDIVLAIRTVFPYLLSFSSFSQTRALVLNAIHISSSHIWRWELMSTSITESVDIFSLPGIVSKHKYWTIEGSHSGWHERNCRVKFSGAPTFVRNTESPTPSPIGLLLNPHCLIGGDLFAGSAPAPDFWCCLIHIKITPSYSLKQRMSSNPCCSGFCQFLSGVHCCSENDYPEILDLVFLHHNSILSIHCLHIPPIPATSSVLLPPSSTIDYNTFLFRFPPPGSPHPPHPIPQCVKNTFVRSHFIYMEFPSLFVMWFQTRCRWHRWKNISSTWSLLPRSWKGTQRNVTRFSIIISITH